MNGSTASRPRAGLLCLLLLASAGVGAALAQSGPGAVAAPHVLQTAPPVSLPLGCRANHAVLLCHPDVDVSPLPEVPPDTTENNPYRGSQAAADIGHRIFNETCAFCHGEDAEGARAPAADLRRFDAHCRRITDDSLRAWCLRDADAYFLRTVLDGKIYTGIVHMPPWRGVLTPRHIWAVRTFIESRALKPSNEADSAPR